MYDNVKSERGMTNCVLHIDESMYFSTTAVTISDNQKENAVLGSLDFKAFRHHDYSPITSDVVSIDGLEDRVNSESLSKTVFSKGGKIVYSEGKGGRYWFSDSDPITLDNLADLIAYSLIREGRESKCFVVPVQGTEGLEFKEVYIQKLQTTNTIEIPLLTFEEATELYNERSNGFCVMEGAFPKLEIVEDKANLILGSELCIDELLAIYWLTKYGIDKMHLKD